jgi:hypothetical protein
MRTTAVALTVATLIAGGAACGGSDSSEANASKRRPSTSVSTTTAPDERGSTSASTTAAPAPPAVDLCPYRDLGAWVDVYDYVPAFAEHGQVAPVTPDAVDEMQARGVHTLYLQVAKDDPRSPGVITDEARAAEFLRRAHAAGIDVVAWYLPTHRDHELDRARVAALARFRAENERFDGIALDIEGTEAVTDIAERNRRLLDLAQTLDDEAGTTPVGAIVYPPVAFDVLNPTLWPDFPWAQLDPHVDIWLPMAYWTYRSVDSGYRDAHR